MSVISSLKLVVVLDVLDLGHLTQVVADAHAQHEDHDGERGDDAVEAAVDYRFQVVAELLELLGRRSKAGRNVMVALGGVAQLVCC